MSGDFAVIGLGRFGISVARRLARQNRSVLVVDRNPQRVDNIAAEVDAAVCANVTDEAAFAELKLERFPCVVVAIGAESIEHSILVTALLKQRGVPRIVARAVNDLHGRVLRAIGANEIVNPEAEMGERLAGRLCQPNLLEHIMLDEKTTLAEMAAPTSFHGRTLVELDVRRRFGVSVVALMRDGDVVSNPQPGETIRPGDEMMVLGSPDAVQKIGSLA